MISPTHTETVTAWFNGLNQGDLEGLRYLFADNPKICNAANPPLTGPDASDRLLEDFFDRTTARHFKLLGMAEGDGHLFAHWQAVYTFRAGIHIAGCRIKHPFTVTLRGVDRFTFADGQIQELDIIHETTTVVRAAQANC